MVDEEDKEHDGADHTQHDHEAERVVVIHHVVNDEHPVGFDCLACRVISELGANQFFLLDETGKNQPTYNNSVESDQEVSEDKGQEVAVVVQADAPVDPDAVVVELLKAYVAHRAVFGAGRLLELACSTFVFFGK
jgi:hypothetical protein